MVTSPWGDLDNALYAKEMKIPKTVVLCCLIGGMILLNACNVTLVGESTPSPAYMEIPYTDLVLGELAPEILADSGIPGCSTRG